MSPITIVIPVYNRQDTLLRTLRSVEMQRVAPAEVILVDNNSSDGSLDVMRRWAEGKRDVRILSERMQGACAARNRGLREVRTEFVEFFDSDDEMLPHHIADFTTAITMNPDADILGRNIVTMRLDGSSRTEHFVARSPMFHHLFLSSLSTGRIVVRTELVRSVGGWNESLSGWDDYELGVRMLLSGGVKPVKVPGPPSVIAYQQEESLTGVDFSSNAGRWEMALDEVYGLCQSAQRFDLLKWVDARCMILAAQYRIEADASRGSEGNALSIDLARRMMDNVLSRTDAPWRMKLIYRHNLYLRRFTWLFARLLFPF